MSLETKSILKSFSAYQTITSIVQIVGSIQSWRLSATESQSPE